MCANSCPENFAQNEEKTLILTTEPGLYEVKMAFFSQLKPTIDFRVNGETIFSSVNCL